MKKYITTTAEKALKKGILKKGDKFTVEFTVNDITNHGFYCITDNGPYAFNCKIKIKIPIPEPKAINFGEAGRVLVNKENNLLICTTGYFDENHFSGYLLKDTEYYKKGYCFNSWSADGWQDITETYNK